MLVSPHRTWQRDQNLALPAGHVSPEEQLSQCWEQLIQHWDSSSQSWEQLSRDWVQLSCGFIINFCVKKSGKSGKSIFSEIPHKYLGMPIYKGIEKWGTLIEVPHTLPTGSPLWLRER